MGPRPQRVLHLVGSAESDFLADLSLHYAAACLAATADPDRYEPVIALVTPDGSWRFPTDLGPDGCAAAPAVGLAEAVTILAGLDLDVAVPQMFCLPGMTHHRALLDLLAIPYVGNPPAVMALTADKARAKAVAAAAGIQVPPGEVVAVGQRPWSRPPVVVKPVAGDNSVGMTLVRHEDALGPALETAWEHGPALVETFVPVGREVRAATLVRDGRVIALPLEEYAVDAEHRPVRDAASKYTHAADGTMHLTAKGGDRAWIVPPDDPVTEVVQAAALRGHAALGCRHYGLFDFRIDPDGQPWFLEAGLYCSFAPQSVIPTMARAAGIPLPRLYADLLHEARTDGHRATSTVPPTTPITEVPVSETQDAGRPTAASTAPDARPTTPSEIDPGRLRLLNLVFGLAHLVQAVIFVLLSEPVSFDVSSTFPTGPPGEPVTPERLEVLFSYPLAPAVAAFSLLSAFFHLLIVSPVGLPRYRAELARGQNRFRWVEYSLSASLMIVLIAGLTGISDVVALVALFGVNASMILFGWLMETHNDADRRVDWTPFVFGSLAGAVPWIAISVYLIGAGSNVPTFVYGIYVSLFLFFNCFALNQWLQYRQVGRWRDYLFGERVYVWLSLTAKSALAWQIFANVLMG